MRERRGILWGVVGLLGGCGATVDTGGSDNDTTGMDCGVYADTDLCTSWMRNTTSEVSAVVVNLSTGAPIPVNVTGQRVEVVNGEDHIVVSSYGIPSYAITLTDEDIAMLNARPNAETDFVTGQTTAVAGQTVDFGTDVGFDSFSPDMPCSTGEGFGWWPPGPGCADASLREFSFPVTPSPAAADSRCETGLGQTGLWVNGVSIYNWGDGFSYDVQGTWQNIAGALEVYDLDLCSGHAARGDYHHHGYSRCLAEALGDAGTGHSPIYGWAADGHPIHGPWFAPGEAVESCWIARDYDDPSDPFGCGGTGERSCLLVDPEDPSLGTTAAPSPGPSTSQTVVSLSGNQFSGAEGLYYQDFYFSSDCADQGGRFLDAHNGHEHDALGYHYHVTETFPFTMGPTLYGTVSSQNDISCDGVGGGAPPQ